MSERKDELLAAARRRLAMEQERLDSTEPDSADEESAAPTMMYRGQVVRRPGASTPSKTDQRGGSRKNAEFQAAVQAIKELYQEGLITRAEAEKKRDDLIKRLQG